MNDGLSTPEPAPKNNTMLIVGVVVALVVVCCCCFGGAVFFWACGDMLSGAATQCGF